MWPKDELTMIDGDMVIGELNGWIWSFGCKNMHWKSLLAHAVYGFLNTQLAPIFNRLDELVLRTTKPATYWYLALRHHSLETDRNPKGSHRVRTIFC